MLSFEALQMLSLISSLVLWFMSPRCSYTYQYYSQFHSHVIATFHEETSSLVHCKSPEGRGHAPTYTFHYSSEISRGLLRTTASQPTLLITSDIESESVLPPMS